MVANIVSSARHQTTLEDYRAAVVGVYVLQTPVTQCELDTCDKLG